MAIQKHNTYYDPKKPNEGITYYDENGNHKEVLTRNDLNAISSISSINDKVTALSAKTVTQIKSTETVTATPHTATDGTIYYELEAAPEISETVIYGINGISSTHEGTVWTIGLSSDFLSANALNSFSGNWQDTYNSVKSNSANWNEVSSKVNSADFIPVKNDVETLKENSAHYPVESTNDFISVNSADHKFTLTFNSGNLATEPWVEEQLKNFGGFTTANPGPSGEPAVDEPSTKLIYLVPDDTVSGKDKYSEWIYGTNSAWICIGETSIDLSPLYELSANFNLHNEDEIRHITSNERINWNEVSSKLDQSAFNSWSAQIENWDITEYSGGFGIDVTDHTISLTENYLSANALDNLSGKWEKASDTLIASSGKWNDTYETVSANSAKWDKVDEKLDTSVFEAYTATADDIPYSGKNGIAIENHEVWISADYLSANALKDLSGKWENASDVVIADSAKWNSAYSAIASANLWNGTYERVQASADEWDKVVNKLDKSESAKYMLVDKIDKTTDDKISGYNGTELYYPPVKEYSGKNGIKVEDYFIGIDSGWLDERYQEKGDYLSASEKFLSANALDELSGNWESTYTTVSTNSATWEKVKDLHNVELSSTNNSIGVTATTAEDGTIKYDLSVDEVEVPNISGYNGVSADFKDNQYKVYGPTVVGENGVSAELDETTNTWKVGLDDNYLSYAQATSQLTVLTTNPQTLGNFDNISVIGDKIALSQNTITLHKGLYHVDIQVNVTINDINNAYYDVVLSNSLSNGALAKVIDGSFGHTETLDLSFDIKLTDNTGTLTFTLNGLPAGTTYFVKNLQIHELTTVDSILEITGGEYTGGDAVSIQNNVVDVKYDSASGIGLNSNNELYVKLGKGLTFDTEGAAAGTLTLDNVTEEVVQTVEELKDDLETKITCNYPPSMIVQTNTSVAAGDSQIHSSYGILIGNLFTVPINHKILVDNTHIGIYCHQNDGGSKAMLGVYEYDPNGNGGEGQTRALCDTGIIIPELGYREYPIKHVLNLEQTEGKMKPGCMYYASIFLGYDRTCGNDGMRLACVPGYDTQFGNLKPVLTVTQNHISAGLNQDYSENLTFNAFGFGWYWNDYRDWDTYTTANYHEAYSTPRFYMSIRNISGENPTVGE